MSVQQEMTAFFEENADALFGNVPASKIVEWAKGSSLGAGGEEGKVSTRTQLRRYYDAIRRVWDDPSVRDKNDLEILDDRLLDRLIFLRPVFIGAAKRNKLDSGFATAMSLALSKIQTKQDLYKFYMFYQSILQYSA